MMTRPIMIRDESGPDSIAVWEYTDEDGKQWRGISAGDSTCVVSLGELLGIWALLTEQLEKDGDPLTKFARAMPCNHVSCLAQVFIDAYEISNTANNGVAPTCTLDKANHH